MIFAATGHRPNKLGGYSAAVQNRLIALAVRFIDRQGNITKGISGMALGWDQAWARGCVGHGVPFVAAVPFKGQELAWPKEAQEEYNRLLGKAEHVVIVSEGGYADAKMQVRNEWMVQRADAMVALHNGSPGGTNNCLKYARRQGKEIINLWSEYANEHGLRA